MLLGYIRLLSFFSLSSTQHSVPIIIIIKYSHYLHHRRNNHRCHQHWHSVPIIVINYSNSLIIDANHHHHRLVNRVFLKKRHLRLKTNIDQSGKALRIKARRGSTSSECCVESEIPEPFEWSSLIGSNKIIIHIIHSIYIGINCSCL